MSKDLIFKEISEIPADIQELWGKPPVLPNESLEDYNKLAVAIANDSKPTDTVDWLLVGDKVYSRWQIRRLHLYKDKVIKIAQYALYEDYCQKENITDEKQKLKVKAWYQTGERGAAKAFRREQETYQRIDSLIASAEVRFVALGREIERRRDARAASRWRKASDDAIDGEFTEHHPASAASGQVTKSNVIPADLDPGKPASAASGQVTKTGVIPANADPGKLASADSGQVKRHLVKKPILPPGSPISLGPKKGVA